VGYGSADRSKQNPAQVRRATAVIGADVKTRRPHFFVRDPMVADDPDIGKIPFQGFNLLERCGFQVNDNGKRVMLSGGVAQIAERLHDMYGMKRIRERGGERMGYVGIALEQDYVCGLHGLLDSRRVTTAAKAPMEREEFAALRCSGLLLTVERFGLNFAVLLEENFHLAFGILQLLPAGSGKLHSFFEKRQRFFQWYFTLFQFLNNFFQALEALFKLWQGETPIVILYLMDLSGIR